MNADYVHLSVQTQACAHPSGLLLIRGREPVVALNGKETEALLRLLERRKRGVDGEE